MVRSPSNFLPLSAAACVGVGLCVLVCVGGCQERVVGQTGWAVYGKSAPPAEPAQEGFLDGIFAFFTGDGSGDGGSEEGNWAIAMGSYQGVNHAHQAQNLVATLLGQGFKDVWTIQEPRNTTVWVGHYTSGQDARARADLGRVHRLVQQGVLTEQSYAVQPVNQARTGGLPQYDLRTAAEKGRYTLQVGYFEDGGVKDERLKLAEQFVKILRERNVDAYYYHGPNRSLVTVGIFGHDAVDPDGNIGPQVAAVQAQFPHHSRNNFTIKMRKPGGGPDDWVMQETFLVKIPGSIDRQTLAPSGSVRTITGPADPWEIIEDKPKPPERSPEAPPERAPNRSPERLPELSPD